MDDIIQKAIELRTKGDLQGSIKLLKDILRKDYHHAIANYQMAWNFDIQGLEREALPFYERALEGSLTSEDRLGAFVGLGSTYRNLGLFDKSSRLLEKARLEFPHDHALRAFHVLALYNLESYQQSFKELFSLMLETTNSESLMGYHKALSEYAKNIDKVTRMDF